MNLIRSKKGNFNDIMSELKKEKEVLSNKNLVPFIKDQIKGRIWDKEIPKINEIKLLEQYKSYIENRVKFKIILNSDFDPKQRAIRATPFKPALFIDI